MSDDEYELFATDSYTEGMDAAAERAASVGIDIEHLFDHLMETALCTLQGDIQSLYDNGLFVHFTDEHDLEWTFSAVPAHGGIVQQALIERAFEG